MANLKAIRKRIVGVQGTQQLTRAMKLVAAAKLRKAQEAALAQRAYAESLGNVIGHLAQRLGAEAHPLLATREVKRAQVLVYSSDRGLCGAFNLNVCRATEQFFAEQGPDLEEMKLAVIGKKAHEYLTRRDREVGRFYKDMFADISFETISRIGNELSADYLDGSLDALYVIFNWFKSAAVQKVEVKQVLPLNAGLPVAEAGPAVEHVFEPDRTTILDRLFPMYVSIQLYQAMLESVASEMGPRMTAMDNATNNADDLIKRLTLIYNKARQESITTELMDIVGGAEALS